jgi:hypothetical protein
VLVTFKAFAAAFAGQARSEFLARVQAPHLLLRLDAAAPADDGDTFRTVATTVAAQAHGERLLAPVQKREGANAFAIMITLGRAANNDIVIPDARVSKLQAYFTRADGGAWQIHDPGSKNGTIVDGAALQAGQALPLRAGAVMSFSGVAECVFLLPADLYELVHEVDRRLATPAG